MVDAFRRCVRLGSSGEVLGRFWRLERVGLDERFERAAEDGELSGDAKARANHTFSESSWT
jgi:hypothetical protein